MSNSFDKVRSFYDGFNEWSRLDTPAGQVEFLRTMDVLREHLPAGGRILDLGGGPGRYTIALARAGYRLCLTDLSEGLVRAAKERIAADREASANVESIDVGNATDLRAYASGSFDAVLALGPFYHLVNGADRQAAAGEIARVMRPGGTVIAAFVPRLSGLAGLVSRAAANPDQVRPETLEAVAERGGFHNASSRGFQEGFYADPDEIRMLFESCGFQALSVTSTQGFAAGQEQQLLQLRDRDPELFSRFMRLIRDTAGEPGAVAMGGHALIVARLAAKNPRKRSWAEA